MKSSKESNRFEDMMQYYSSRRGGQDRGDRAERKEKVTEYLKNLNIEAKKHNAQLDSFINEMFNQGQYPKTHEKLNLKLNESSKKNLTNCYKNHIEKNNSEYRAETNLQKETDEGGKSKENVDKNKRWSDYSVTDEEKEDDDDEEDNNDEDIDYIGSLPSQQRSAIFKILNEASNSTNDIKSDNLSKKTKSGISERLSTLSKILDKEELKSLRSKFKKKRDINEDAQSSIVDNSPFLNPSISESIIFKESSNKSSNINEKSSENKNKKNQYLSRVERENILRKALLDGNLLEKYEEITAGTTSRININNTESSVDLVTPIMERLKSLNDLKKKHSYKDENDFELLKPRSEMKVNRKVIVKPYGVSTGRSRPNSKGILSKSILAKHFIKHLDDIKD